MMLVLNDLDYCDYVCVKELGLILLLYVCYMCVLCDECCVVMLCDPIGRVLTLLLVHTTQLMPVLDREPRSGLCM